MAIEDDFERDAVQGLVDYVNEIKPYHTKIIDVLVEYIYTDTMNVSFSESVMISEEIGVNRVILGCDDGYDTGGFDFLAGNVEPGYAIAAVSVGLQTITLNSSDGDVTASFPTGKAVAISDSTGNDGNYIVDFSTFNGSETVITLAPGSFLDPTGDGEISAYVDDSLDLPLSNYDETIDPGCDLNIQGQSGGTEAIVSFGESLIVTVEFVAVFGGSFDDLDAFDPIDGGGFEAELL